jgi:hypothetical protein
MLSAARILTASGVVFVLFATAGIATAQQNDARSVIAVFERNRKALQDYGWKSRMETSLDGEIVVSSLSSARYDASGEVVKDPIDVESPTPSPLRPVRRHKAKKLGKKVERTRQGLVKLIGSYIEIGPDKLQAAFRDARVTEGSSGGFTLIRTRNVIRTGDQMKILVDPETLAPRRFEIVSSLEGEPVQLRTQFVDMELGPSYPAQIVIETEIKEKKMVITTENFDYARIDP